MSDTMKELARPFPDNYVRKNPSGGGDYVPHHIVVQRLIMVLKTPPTFERVEVIYGNVAAIVADPKATSKRGKEGRPALTNAVVGVICRMKVEIDNREVTVEEVGDCEEPHNWSTDGQRLKDAMSDAYKRCAMRLGCGLHLWSQKEYYLFDELLKSSGSDLPPSEPTAASKAPTAASAAPSGGGGSSAAPSKVTGGGADDAQTVSPNEAGSDAGSPASKQQEMV